jgi:hypothetical protein
MNTTCLRLLALGLALSQTLACSDDDEGGEKPASDAGADAGDAGGGAPSGARAWVLDEADLPDDPTGLGVYRAGDFGLANERIAVLIEDVGFSDLYDPWGGKIVGMAAVEDGKLVRTADFNELLIALGRYVLATDSVEIEADGSAGGPARIRARGMFTALPFIDDFATGLFPDDYSVPGSMLWELEPGADHVNVYLGVDRSGEAALVVDNTMNLVFQRERMQEFTANQGFEIANGSLPHLAFVDDRTTSFAFLSPNGNLTQPVDPQAGFNLLGGPTLTFAADDDSDVLAYRLVLGGPGLDGLQQALARLQGTPLPAVSGRVLEADGTRGAAGVHVHATGADDAYLSRALTDDSGAFTLHVPEGAVTLTTYRTGSASVSLQAHTGDSDLTLELPASATLRLSAEDGAGASTPFRAQVLPMDEADEPPANFGEKRPGAGRMYLESVVEGELDLPVPAGTYHVVISRGYEYGLHDEEVIAVAGETVTVEATLEHVVDTTGVMCADAHIHTHRSPDASDDGLMKVRSALAEGLDIAIRSEHEWVADFSAEVQQLGAAALLYGDIGGEELTTFEWGHMGVFPLLPSDQPNAGAIEWTEQLPPAVFELVRARPEQPVLVINHPRLPGGLLGARQAYFDVAGFDSVTGMIENPELWDEEFRLIELFNSENFETQRAGTVRDLFQLLNSGRKVFGVGASDSHTVASVPLGYPRTCLLLGEDAPAELTPELVRDAYDAGHSTVSGGIFLSVALDGQSAGPGDTASGVGTSTLVNVKVQAANWVDVTALEVIVDGVTTETFPIDASSAVVRFEQQVMVPVAAEGSWVVFHAKGDASLAPLHPDKLPFAFSNPIFLER